MFALHRLMTAALLALATPVFAVQPETVGPSTDLQTPLCDPCLPPALRNTVPAAPTEGAALQAQVERKLRQSFDAADVARRGALTRDEARAAGLGLVANEFDRIDAAKRGRVTFEDVKRYLRERGGKL